MLKRICDRCNKEIIGNYWTIDKLFDKKKEYCEDCINEIKEKIVK